MPAINITMLPASKEKKQEIIKEVTQAMIKVTKAPAEAFTIVINEVSADNFGVGGLQLTEMMQEGMKKNESWWHSN